MKRVIVVWLILTSVTYAVPTFTQKPIVKKQGVGANISFAVSENTDVAVYVLDKNGKTVRHLAAGVLGPKAPAPLKPNSLSQVLTWDGKDNQGHDVSSGVYFCQLVADSGAWSKAKRMVLLR